MGDACDVQFGWSYAQLAADMVVKDIWGTSPSDIYACGNSGILLTRLFHYDGSIWQEMDTPAMMGLDLLAMWGTSSNNFYVSGFMGSFWHYDGAVWSEATTLSNGILDIWGTAADEVFAVGNSGAILHFDGSAWSSMSSGSGNQLQGVWGSAGDDVFAVGQYGTMLHYDGIAWMPVDSGVSYYLYDIWGSAADNVFAVGEYGTILHYNGTAWSAMQSPATGPLYSVWGASASDVYAVGAQGTVLHYDGSTWSQQDISAFFAETSSALQSKPFRVSVLADTVPNLMAVWGSTAQDVYAGGEEGTVLHFGAQEPTMVTLTAFTAQPRNGAIVLSWETAAEVDNAGFNLYRATAAGGPYEKINAVILPARGTAVSGARYMFRDARVRNRTTYHYRLEDVDLDGASTMHGPVSATPRLVHRFLKWLQR